MAEPTKESGVLVQLFRTFFGKHWPVWVGGIVLGTLNILLFAIKSPWGASGGINNWGENVFSSVGLINIESVAPVNENLYGMLCLLIVVGSFIGALFSKEFAFRIPPRGELIKGFIGGGIMAIGATVGIGCTIGAFFSGVPALSGGALVFTIGLFIGVIIALRYLLWEMDKFPKWSSGKSYNLLAAKPNKGGWQIVLGWIFLIGVIILAYSYVGSNLTMTWFIIIGGLMGMISQRSRFCIVKAFRDPFMSGESHGAVGVMAGLLVGLVGFTAIKLFGIGAEDASIRAREMTWVFPHFWAKAGIGGLIFGIGMTIAGGCAVGTLWRVGEGQVKLWMSAIGFLLISPISKIFIVPSVDNMLPHSMKYKNFLPDYIGYDGAVALVIAIIIIWYWFVKWNEKTGKFSAF
ncbi:MAG: YeeE/YedE family protein [Bacteroidetes bacterium]|nr:YeeE/YedE family protein [Bacteroidota bacterium]